ncbi:MAG: type III PLP-dependent enzyme [Alphaproteobacteria bacterium]|nr:type III PLP-dependent enzyme [Alphaproteobacteria bacterium]
MSNEGKQGAAYENVASLIKLEKPHKPVLCFGQNKIRSKIQEFRKGFPGTLSWAVKSNPHDEVIRTIVDTGVTNFDVASKGEIDQIIRSCPDGTLHYNNPVKSPEDIEHACFRAGVRNFVVDCHEEVRKLTQVFNAVSPINPSEFTMLVRFMDPNSNGSDNYNFGLKFGAEPNVAADVMRYCRNLGYKVGLTFHTGSQNRRPESFGIMMNKAHQIAMRALDGNLSEFVRLNVGGGFPCQYPGATEPALSEYFESISAASNLLPGELICEPGRALVADSMSVLTRVTLRRGQDNRLYINDGFYGSFMELPFVDFMPPARAYNPEGVQIVAPESEMKEFYIWGPTCDSLDKLPKTVRLPAAISMGDYIEFGLMGAYTNASSTMFNGFEPARLLPVKSLEPW